MIILVWVFVLCLFKSNGQTIAEWMQQKKTQIKYLQQQIVALQIYIGYAKEGYNILHRGTDVISDIKKGDFNLHSDYFNSLKSINPNVEQYSKIAEMIAMHKRIIKIYKTTSKKAEQSDQFTTKEISYILRVFASLLNDSFTNINELTDILQPGKFEMKDDERIRRIEILYNDTEGMNIFAQHFSNEINLLSVQRLKENYEVKNSRLLNDLNK